MSADIKRVVLTTLEPQKVSDKPSKKYYKTVRIRVSLAESNEDKCPEYCYKDELAAVKKKLKQNGNKESNSACNGVDPFGEENDDDVRRIALEMEAKYGAGMSGTKKKRKSRRDDYADIGAGYNESDSFIDNTDGYDEMIPPNITTAQGGFYINSGALEFKTDDEATSEISSSSSDDSSSSSEEEEDDGEKDNPNKASRKRALDTSDEEEGSSHSNQDQTVKPTEKQTGDKPHISMQQAIKQKMFSTEKIQIKKRKLANEQNKNKIKEVVREKKDTNSSDGTKETLKENKQPMRLSSVDAAIDSVIGRVEDTQILPKSPEAKHVQQNAESPEKNEEQQSPVVNSQAVNVAVEPLEYVKLPENLPADILEIIEFIKKAAAEHKDNGKLKFFSDKVNNMLLNLERKCKVLGRTSRLRVYEHLSPFVKCRKESLIKRARNLVFEEENKKLFKTISKLKSQIDQLLPALITNYEKECQRVLEKKFSKEAATDETLKNLKTPRRKFPLHDEMKKMVRDIVLFKKRCLLHEGKSKDSLENLLADYLKTSVLTLWPDGWMTMNVLRKFCSSSAIKTPNPKAATTETQSSGIHSQKPPASSSITNYSSGNTLTITPVNLADKLSEVSNNNITTTKTTELLVKPKVKPLPQPESQVKHKEKTVFREVRDKPRTSEPVIPKDLHCQVIDLTDAPGKVPDSDTIRPAYGLTIEPASKTFEATLKSKFPGLSVTAKNVPNDKDDVQKVMESLKALQKLSSPSKTEVTSPGVSVIAYNNKNYSNSNSSQSGGVSNEGTNLSGVVGYPDEFQKQFVSSLAQKNPPPGPSTKPGYNRCS